MKPVDRGGYCAKTCWKVHHGRARLGGQVLQPYRHIRSNYSDDGYYDVEELFKQAKDNGLEVISITDHNCARANAGCVSAVLIKQKNY